VMLAVLAGIGYTGSKLVPPYWDYLSMLDPVKEAAWALSHRAKEDQVRADLIARAKNIGIVLTEENVEIAQEGNVAVVRVVWEVPLELPIYRRSLRFRIEQGVPAP
jgi:hypothetical protein